MARNRLTVGPAVGGPLLLRFKLLEPRPSLTAYAERLGARPSAKRAEARNAAVIAERGLGR